ncbi:MAG: hypothetical protein HYS52_01210 [Candidatus Wildermuthbacteria bacterium]|nr:hypothetical protein [Candidatus Wildermuthbacteria bacterium]
MIEILLPIGRFAWEFALTWWWLFLPFLLFGLFVFTWLWWRTDRWLTDRRWIVLEIRMPQEVDNPFRRMEAVIAGFWQVKIGKNKREKWIEGKIQLGVALEIASIEGKVHFFVRFEQDERKLIESSIYAQFPEAEITEVDDYTKLVPADIPNKDWEMWASSYEMPREDVYPIKTYRSFFEEQATTREEEPIRVDPLGQLLEGMAKLGPGEHMWIQILASPVDRGTGYEERGKAIVDKIVHRPERGKPTSTVKDVETVFSVLATGKTAEQKTEQESFLPPEMRITPGERVIVMGIEEKIAKLMFSCHIRSVYVAKRDVYWGGMKAIPMSYFTQFTTENMNGLKVDGDTWTKVHTISTWFLDKRRLYLRKRRHFRYYKGRFNIHFPRSKGSHILNIEELASLFHFPGKLTAPSAALERVEAKKGEAPPVLPTE